MKDGVLILFTSGAWARGRVIAPGDSYIPTATDERVIQGRYLTFLLDSRDLPKVRQAGGDRRMTAVIRLDSLTDTERGNIEFSP